MNLRQQIIQDKIDEISKRYALSKDQAFLRFSHSLVTGCRLRAFDQDDLVEGGQEKQVDTITIDRDDDRATIYIIQAKNKDTFSSNVVIQMRNGLEWIFNKSKADIAKLKNIRFKDKILEYRSLQNELGPSNLEIIVAYATKGLSGKISDEFEQEKKTILDMYDNQTFSKFDFQVWGVDEFVSRLNFLEKSRRKINADIKVLYDTNNPSLIKYHVGGLKGLVCTAYADEIARIVNNDVNEAVFDSNVRKFLGMRGAVNSDIRNTCTSSDEGHRFWFLNNGITIICDDFEPVTDPDNPHVKIKNMQIVNGCQTAKAIALAHKEGELVKGIRVLLRIYETQDKKLVDRIVLTTNNQNKIGSRDLRANDQVQVDMQKGFKKYGYSYERKDHEYDHLDKVKADRLIENEIVAQSYLSIVLRRPSDASRRKYKIWGEMYDQIFCGRMIEIYVFSALLFLYSKKWLRHSTYAGSSDAIRRKLAKNGAFHIARIAAFLLKGNDNWDDGKFDFKKLISDLRRKPQALDGYWEKAFKVLEKVIRDKTEYASDLDRALKSNALDSDIDRQLHITISTIN